MAIQALVLGERTSTAQNIGDIASLTGRVMLSALFLVSALGKVTAPAATIGYIGSAGLPLATMGFAIAVAIELGGSLALLLGYRTRIAATLMAVFTVATALGFHRDLADPNQFVHFMKNVAIAGGMLQIIAFGPGRFSIESRQSNAI